MKKNIMTLLLTLFISSCAHNHGCRGNHDDCNHSSSSGNHSCDDNCQHDEAMYDMHCAYSMSEGNYGMKGNRDYHWNHNGKMYYFSSEENKNKFMKDKSKNIEKANIHWEKR